MKRSRRFRSWLRQHGYLGIAVRRCLGGGSAALPTPSFAAALTTSIVPDRGIGAATFTRATIATIDDWEGRINNVLSGEARFRGARRVRNWLTFTEDFTNAAWTTIAGGTGSVPTKTNNFGVAPDGTTTACRLQATIAAGTTAADFALLRQAVTAVTTGKGSAWIKSNTGSTQNVLVFGFGTPTVVAVTTTWQRFSAGQDPTTFDIGCKGNSAADKTLDILIWHPMSEDVVGQTNTNPSEYVSVSVLSAPYHGANVDGVKYFATQNGNTVAVNVVTEATGAAISTAVLLGYMGEGARPNLCFQSSDFATTWTVAQATISANAVGSPDGTTTADKLQEDNTTNVHSVIQTVAGTVNSGATVFSVYVKAVERTKIYIEVLSSPTTATGISAKYDLSAVTTNSATNAGTATGAAATITALAGAMAGWYRCTLTGIQGNAETSQRVGIYLCDAANATNYLGITGNGVDLWGAQLEQAAFASTYVPTTTAAVTRNVDLLSDPTAGNINGPAGACYVEYQVPTINPSANQYVAAANGGVGIFSGTTGMASVYDSTTITATANTITAGAVSKAASAWSGSTERVCLNGGAVASGVFDGDLSVSTPMFMGSNPGGTQNLFGTLRNVKIWQQALTDAQLKTLTT